MLRRVFRLLALAALVGAAALVGMTLLYGAVSPVSTLMLGRWLTGRAVERTSVPIEAISPHLPLAVIASEDSRFCDHGGVDWDAIRTVVEEADEDGPARGASTVPMQTAKNLFLWPSRSYVRKGLELPSPSSSTRSGRSGASWRTT
jgi:monofunctional biosynthetic peptidoglycan transglycosylase